MDSGNRFGERNVAEAGQMVGTKKEDVGVYFGEFEAGTGQFGGYPVFGTSEFLAVGTVTD